MSERGRLFKIGELARLSGVPVKTIRFYSDLGILPPSEVNEAGYRLYSDTDRARLALIRTLREIGLDLQTIRALLEEKITARQALALQLEAVEVELRTLKRRRALLKAALRQGEETALSYLNWAGTLAKLDALDREGFLSRHLERAFEGVPVDETWKATFWQGAVLDLPDEMSEAQLEAWLELAELVSDPAFLRRLNEMGRATWEAIGPEQRRAEWSRELQAIYREAVEALQAGELPDGERGQALVERYLQLHARVFDRSDDPDLAAFLIAATEQRTEPAAERYWELIAVLKGWEPGPTVGDAHRWLVQGLRHRANAGEPGGTMTAER